MSFAVNVCEELVHIMWISQHYRTVNVHQENGECTVCFGSQYDIVLATKT